MSLLDTVDHTCNLGSWEVETGRLLRVPRIAWTTGWTLFLKASFDLYAQCLGSNP